MNTRYQSKECQKCSSLDGCINLMKGYHPHLVISGGSIEVHYDKCPSKVMDDEKRKMKSSFEVYMYLKIY